MLACLTRPGPQGPVEETGWADAVSVMLCMGGCRDGRRVLLTPETTVQAQKGERSHTCTELCAH